MLLSCSSKLNSQVSVPDRKAIENALIYVMKVNSLTAITDGMNFGSSCSCSG